MLVVKSAERSQPILSRRQIIVQIVGFALGAALLGWCLWIAVKQGDWSRVRNADLLLIAGLAGFTIVGLLVNGVIFWAVIQPVRHVRLLSMVWLNFLSSLFNYAPIRAGLLARIAYNLRVDQLSLLEIAAWFAAIGLTLAIAVLALLGATIVRPQIDWLWWIILLAQVIVAGLVVRVMARGKLLERFGRGIDRMLRAPLGLWGAIVLRIADVAAITGRMWCAAEIMGLDFSWNEIVILSLASLAASLNPLGRIGYREAGVAFVAGLLASGTTTAATLNAHMIQLALIESVGEAIVFIPLGLAALPWYWLRMRRKTGPSEG